MENRVRGWAKKVLDKNNIGELENIKEPPRPKSSILDIVKYIVFAVSFYTYFSGALFFYGYMNGMGFDGVSLDSLFSPLIYSNHFIIALINEFYKTDVLHILYKQAPQLLLFPVLVFCILLLLGNSSKTKSNLREVLLKNKIASAILSYPIIVASYLLTWYGTLFIGATVLVPLYIPYQVGVINAKKLLENDNGVVCKSMNWNDNNHKDKKIVLSCDRVKVGNHSKSVYGKIMFTDSRYIYMNTNYLILRLNGNRVVSCANKQRNEKTDNNTKLALVDSLPIANEFKNCDELYKAVDEEK
ncbi:hypothetical protein [Shewanella sp.]|uniref:hypothetical protein n=1 Tax=Shewanella sp. TaxID=50422 RepID=UPI003D12987E